MGTTETQSTQFFTLPDWPQDGPSSRILERFWLEYQQITAAALARCRKNERPEGGASCKN